MASATPDEVQSAFEAGIRGCIFKREEASEFVRILESIGQGNLYVPPELGAVVLRQGMGLNAAKQDKTRPFNLTSREQQILACVARALTNKEIARELQISEKTVKHYMLSLIHI